MTEGAIAVTGANRGIGAAIALELARRGFTVGCLTRSGEVPETEQPTVERLIPERADVTDPDALARALAALSERAGGLRGLVNNAGIHLHGESAAFGAARFAEVMAVNATGLFAASAAAYPHLAARGGGLIVNIGSFWERLGVKGNTAYCASKAAVSAITRCLAVEWAAQNIRVLTVAPGYVETDLNAAVMGEPRFRAWLDRRVPMGRPGRPEEIARLVAALFVEDIPYLTGETITVDGAQTINQ